MNLSTVMAANHGVWKEIPIDVYRPLQWSKDEDDDQAQMMSSSQLIDVPLYWRRKKNSFYIIFITQGNCF